MMENMPINVMTCNKEFTILVCETKAGPRTGTCCSNECRKLYYKEENSVNWKGGILHATGDNGPWVMIKRANRVTPYIGKHRLICEHLIGRHLHRTEVVLRLDGNHFNAVPENLYICKNLSDAGKYLMGGWIWPNKSNLDTYR